MKKLLLLIILNFLILLTLWAVAGFAGSILEERKADSEAQDAGESAMEIIESEQKKDTLFKEVVPVMKKEAHGEIQGVLTIPRLGSDWMTEVRVGDESDQISCDSCVDFYPMSDSPGELGNFALAGHISQQSEIGRFKHIHTLQPGDPIVFHAKEGDYSYKVREQFVVNPDASWVLDSNPKNVGAEPVESVITLTTCFYDTDGTLRRLIVIGVFDGHTL